MTVVRRRFFVRDPGEASRPDGVLTAVQLPRLEWYVERGVLDSDDSEDPSRCSASQGYSERRRDDGTLEEGVSIHVPRSDHVSSSPSDQ